MKKEKTDPFIAKDYVIDPETGKTINDRIYTKKTVEESDDESCTSEHESHVEAEKTFNNNDDESKETSLDGSSDATPRSWYTSAINSFRFLYSCALLIFCVVLVMAAMFTKQTIGTDEKGIHPALAFFLFWFLICWLAMMEGGQGCLVGLQPIEKELYRESHPRTWKNTTLIANGGHNMERFIVGRQFLVVLVVFVSNLMSSAVDGASLFGMPHILNEIFLESGVALMLTTIVLGQLTAQLNAADCMLDFINNYFMLYFVTYLSLLIEFSGILHAVYLVQMFFSKITGEPLEGSSNEDQQNRKTRIQRFFFWGRIVLSVALLGFAFAVTMTALFDGKTTMWDAVPPYVSVILFFLLMCFVGMMEGMQIALFAVVNLPSLEGEEFKEHHPRAYKNCSLTFAGQNMQAFLIGRQICVTICMFVVARIATLDYSDSSMDDNIFGVSDGIQKNLFDTGLLGALITTIVASLIWRVVASSFPVAFLSNPAITFIIRLCFLLERSGLCSSAWVLAHCHKKLVGYQRDEVYLMVQETQQTAVEDQGTKNMDDEVEEYTTHTDCPLPSSSVFTA